MRSEGAGLTEAREEHTEVVFRVFTVGAWKVVVVVGWRSGVVVSWRSIYGCN